jgi:hypothetical protein
MALCYEKDMFKNPDPTAFIRFKDLIETNLDLLLESLEACIDEKHMTLEDQLYGMLLDLMKNVDETIHWNRLEDLVYQAKILEHDIVAFLSMHGLTSHSLDWTIPSHQ